MKKFILILTISLLAQFSATRAMTPQTYGKSHTLSSDLTPIPARAPFKKRIIKELPIKNKKTVTQKKHSIEDDSSSLNSKYTSADNFMLNTEAISNKKAHSTNTSIKKVNHHTTEKADFCLVNQDQSASSHDHDFINKQNRAIVSSKDQNIIHLNLLKNSLTTFNAVYRSSDAYSLLYRIKQDGYVPYKSSEDHNDDHTGYYHSADVFCTSQDLYESHSKISRRIVSQLEGLMSMAKSPFNHASIAALKEIEFLLKYSASNHIYNSIFKDITTWNSYQTAENSRFNKRKLANLALILIGDTARNAQIYTSASYESLLNVFNHIKEITKNTTSTQSAIKAQDPKDERNITIRKKRTVQPTQTTNISDTDTKANNTAVTEETSVKNNSRITVRRPRNSSKKVTAAQYTHTATPKRYCVQKSKNLPASRAITFVDFINTGDYHNASKLLSSLSGYQAAAELRNIANPTVKSSLFTNKKKWQSLNTRHINKEHYGRMALYLLSLQAQNGNLSPQESDYLSSVISIFNKELNINLSPTNAGKETQ